MNPTRPPQPMPRHRKVRLPIRDWLRVQFTPMVTQSAPTAPAMPMRIRLLVSTACAARGGIGQMTLNDWREVEQDVKRKLQYECY